MVLPIGNCRISVSAWRGGTAQKTFGAQILVNGEPVYAIPTAGNLPIAALLGRRVQQSGIPRERHGDGTAILETDTQSIVSEENVSDCWICRCRLHGFGISNCLQITRTVPSLISL